MKDLLKERVLARNLIIFSAGVIIALILFVKLPDVWALTWSLLAAVILLLLALILEHVILPPTFRNLSSDMAAAAKTAEENGTLRLIFQQIYAELADDLAKLRNYTYIDETGTIPELSIKAMFAVTQSAFATFIADDREHIYEDNAGRAYINTWYEKADDLGKDKLHRVFITGKMGDLTDEAVRHIEKHLQHNVAVWVIERDKVQMIRQTCELDFGLFDSDCLMTVKSRPGMPSKLSVYVRGPKGENAMMLKQYEQFKTRLLQEATGAEEFLQTFNRPMNALFWSRRLLQYSPRLGPPHGLSKVDAKEMLDKILRNRPDPAITARIGVLGLTPELLEACTREPLVREVFSIDQAKVATDIPYDRKVTPIQANWLEFCGKHEFDGVLGDEALNNLNIQQYRSFFRSMHRALKPNGLLVLRTLGRYEGAQDHLNIEPEVLLDWIKNNEGQSESQCAARIIEFLHSRHIAFDPKRQVIEAKRYNSLLNNWVAKGEITAAKANVHYFPGRNLPDLILSSADIDQLEQSSRDYFEPMHFSDVDSTYCGPESDLSQFYRITPFVARMIDK
jgi:SAM-dependent methyltransferase